MGSTSASERCEIIRKRRNEIIASLLMATKPAAVAVGAGKTKKKKLVKTRLPPELVAEIVARPITPVPVIPDEMLAEFSERFRAVYASQKASAEKLMAIDADIIAQYNARGYAEMEEEVSTDEDYEEKPEN